MGAVNEMTIGQVARQSGVNVQTLRFYEREGFLPKPPRTTSGYRTYSDETVARLRFMKHAQELGFTLKEAVELLALREHPETACADARRHAQQKVADIDAKMETLRTMRTALMRLAKSCGGRARSHTCPLLEELEQPSELHAKRQKLQR